MVRRFTPRQSYRSRRSSFRKAYAKRRRVTRKTYRRRRPTMARAPRAARLGVIPQKLFHTFKYCTNRQVPRDGASGVGVYRFNLNSLHDPDYTGAGHQPADHDLLLGTSNQLYNRYIVHCCSYSLSLVNENATQAEVLIGLMPSAEAASPVDDWDRMCESPNFKHFTLGTDGGGTSIKKVTGKAMVKGVEGVQKLDISQFSAMANSNPSRMPQLVVYTRLVNEAVTGSPLRVLATLWFKAQLYDRNLKRTVD